MRKHLQYLKYVMCHKWFVFLGCVKYGIFWRGLVHDWSKFLPSEWFPYVEYFYGEKIQLPNSRQYDKTTESWRPIKESPEHVKSAFDRAWNFHQKRNDHHWQFWLLTPDIPRPNLTLQSYDGGMSHVYICMEHLSKRAGLVFDASIEEWLETDKDAVEQLERDLNNTPVALPMPDVCRKEMLADWRGAGRALGKPKTWEWYEAHKKDIVLHPDTRAWVESELNAEKQEYESDMKRLIVVGS